jgi:hypothetical protein
MTNLTAPITRRQLELLQARTSLERRMSFETTPPNGYGLAAQVEAIDDALATIERAKRERHGVSA